MAQTTVTSAKRFDQIARGFVAAVSADLGSDLRFGASAAQDR
jgi:hypothetical protein